MGMSGGRNGSRNACFQASGPGYQWSEACPCGSYCKSSRDRAASSDSLRSRTALATFALPVVYLLLTRDDSSAKTHPAQPTIGSANRPDRSAARVTRPLPSRHSLGVPCSGLREYGCVPASRRKRASNANTLYGKIAKTRAGNPVPSFGLGKVTIASAPASGTLSRFVSSSIW